MKTYTCTDLRTPVGGNPNIGGNDEWPPYVTAMTSTAVSTGTSILYKAYGGGRRVTQAYSITGSTVLTLTPDAGVSFFLAGVTVTASASYAASIILSLTNRAEADRLLLKVTMPASLNPAITLRNGGVHGLRLASVPTSAISKTWLYLYVLNLGVWRLLGYEQG